MQGLIVIPAYNEEGSIARTIERVRAAHCTEHVVVVNDGSKDGTARVLDQLGVHHIDHVVNKGYVGALRTGMRHALDTGADYMMFIDADGQHDPNDIPRLREVALRPGGPDIVVGSRFVHDPSYKAPLGRKAGMVLFSHMTKWVAGRRVYDTTCGFKVLNRKTIELVHDKAFGDFHAEMLIFCIVAGLTVEEVPIVVAERETGTSMYGIAASLKYPFKTLAAIAKLYPAAKAYKKNA